MTRDSRTRGSNRAPSVDLKSLDDGALRELIRFGMNELLSRAVAEEDPDVLMRYAMEEMFTTSGEPKSPQLLTPNVIALAGIVRDTSATKHSCSLYTITLPDDQPPVWAWEDQATLIHSESEKVGKVRRSVALHLAVSDMEVARHDMTHDGERHQRVSSRAWIVDVREAENGESEVVLEPKANYTPTHLPPPQGEEDLRSARARNN